MLNGMFCPLWTLGWCYQPFLYSLLIRVFIASYLCSLFIWPAVQALEVAPDSPCSPLCLDNPKGGNASDTFASTTQEGDLICLDSEYASTPRGRKFVQCLQCEGQSRATHSNTESDLNWFICE